MTEWFQQLRTIYLVLEDRHRQALWNRFIKYIYPTNNGDAIQNWRILQNLKQRRLRPGRSWKTVLRFILRGMVLGHCDLDILLDPFFLHLPLTTEIKLWYPCLECKQKNIPNFLSALSKLDSTEPWRNQYRASIADHPGSLIPR